MNFWKSDLVQNLVNKGEVPVIKTDNQVTIQTDTLVKLGITLIAVATAITLLVMAARAFKPKA
jgi:hypothetical protein